MLDDLERLLAREMEDLARHFFETGDATAVLGTDADRALDAMLGAAVQDKGDRTEVDVEALGPSMFFAYARYSAAGRDFDHVLVNQLVSLMQRVAPQLVPPALMAILDDGPRSTSGAEIFEEAEALLGRSVAAGDAAGAEQATGLLRVAVEVVAEQDRPVVLLALGGGLLDWYHLGGPPEAMHECIDIMTRALDDPRTRRVPTGLVCLGAALLARYRRDRDPADLDAAERALRTVAAGERVFELVSVLHEKALRSDDALVLDEAIETGVVNRSLLAGDLRQPQLDGVLAKLFALRHERTGTPADRDAAIDALRRSLPPEMIELHTRQHPEALVAELLELGLWLTARAGDRSASSPDDDSALSADRDEVVDLARTALRVLPDLPQTLGALGVALRVRGRPGDLDEAVAVLDRARELGGGADTDRSLLAALAVRRADGDRVRWIEVAEETVAAMRFDDPERVDLTRFLVSAMIQEATEHRSADMTHRALRWCNSLRQGLARERIVLLGLTAGLHLWFDLTEPERDNDTVHAAITTVSAFVGAAGVAVLSDNDAAHVGDARLALAVAGEREYTRTGDVATLTATIDHVREALRALPFDSPLRRVALHLAGPALLQRSLALGSGVDALEAVRATQSAFVGVPDGDPDRVPLLINLGHALRNAAEFSGDAEHYRAAAETYREVLAGHTNTTQMTSVNAGLGVTLGQLAKIEHDPTLLGEAAVLLRQALTTRGVPEEIRVEAANNLSGLVLTQLEMGTATDDDLDALITLLESAVDIGRRTSWAATALNLAEVLRKRTKDGDLAAARRWYRAAADNPASPTWVRVYAARMWGGLADNPDEVIAGYTQAVGLLPRLAWRGLPSREQQRELGRLNGISSEAAAAALTAGRPETAVELLEHGRSVLWNQLMSARTDVSAATLRAAAESRPDLTDELTRVRAELAQAAPEPAAGAGLPPELAAGQERMALAHREEQVLAEIAVITGVNGAVRKRPFAELRHAAADGPVVLVNVSRRCDAIVLHPDGAPQVVRLDTDHAEVQRRAEQVVTAWRRPGVGGYASAQETLAEVLDWAWHTVTGPVLDALDGEAGMRVWWCPTGPLTLIPLHAAADLRSPAPQRDALARITSSATSTLSALLDARARTTAAPERILVVGVSHPEGLPPLPGVPGEVETVRTHAAPAPNVLTGPEATVDRVLQDLPEHAWLHVAGHGHQDLADPSNSGLSLHDRRLTVTELTGLRLDNAQFAFLSACEASAATRIPDEAIHPAAALQFAGFRHVVATLWPIPDQTGTELTGALYSAIGTDADAAPSALREAVRQVRSRHPYEPTTWASYVHWGP